MSIRKISYVRNLAIVVLAGIALTGCFDDTPDTGQTQTVAWYKAHDAERKATLEKCANNPGELQKTPNCINVLEAERGLSSGKPFELNLSDLKGKEGS